MPSCKGLGLCENGMQTANADSLVGQHTCLGPLPFGCEMALLVSSTERGVSSLDSPMGFPMAGTLRDVSSRDPVTGSAMTVTGWPESDVVGPPVSISRTFHLST
jgi:hypothetical protein